MCIGPAEARRRLSRDGKHGSLANEHTSSRSFSPMLSSPSAEATECITVSARISTTTQEDFVVAALDAVVEQTESAELLPVLRDESKSMIGMGAESKLGGALLPSLLLPFSSRGMHLTNQRLSSLPSTLGTESIVRSLLLFSLLERLMFADEKRKASIIL